MRAFILRRDGSFGLRRASRLKSGFQCLRRCSRRTLASGGHGSGTEISASGIRCFISIVDEGIGNRERKMANNETARECAPRGRFDVAAALYRLFLFGM